MKVGYSLSSEEHDPRALIEQAKRAERAGFHALWISDHYHPWNDAQGHSPFVWAVIGAIAATTELPVVTGVTCPTIRIHPAVIAQAAATSSLLLEGRFALGVGSGEALNEHILGDRWPEADERLEMLEEAIEVMRLLWSGGTQSHRGRHYRVENARVYDLPDRPPAVIVSGFGPEATRLAARVGDGYATTSADAELIELYRSEGGQGVVQAGAKVCFGPDEAKARELVHRLWPNSGLPGELAQILPTPAHFEQAAEIIDVDTAVGSIPCGPDLDRHAESLQTYADAGVDELFVHQIGPDHDAFFEEWTPAMLQNFDSHAPGASREKLA